MVIFSHASGTYPPSCEKWLAVLNLFGNGEYGVTIFFVLSGYLITSILLREFDNIGRIDMKAFYMRRILRIFPAFYLFFFFIVGLAAIGAIYIPLSGFLFAGTHLINYSHAIQLIFKLPDTPYPDYWFIGHFWSLSMEEQFYWMWPVTLLLLLRKRWWGVLVPVILAMPLIRLVSYFAFPGLRGQLGMMLHSGSDGIFSGCLLAILMVRRPEFCRKLLLPAGLVALAPIYVYLISPLLNMVMPRGFDMVVGMTLLLVVVNVFITNVLWQAESTWYHRFLENRFLVFTGQISYSLYLWQQIFLTPLNTTWLGIWPINIAASFAAAWISFRYIERPLIKLKDRLFPSHTKKVPAPNADTDSVAVPAA